jgi:hypothetical protein
MHSANWNRRVLVISGDGATRNTKSGVPIIGKVGAKGKAEVDG